MASVFDQAHVPVIPINPQQLHSQPIVNFADEEQLKAKTTGVGPHQWPVLRLNRWLALDAGSFRICRINWVVAFGASAIIWAFVIGVLTAKEDAAGTNTALTTFGMWQSWITQNFTWLYIGTQDAWGFFVLYMAFSRFGKLKLGKDTEKPAFDDYTWFSLLFCCGIGIGLYMWGVSEPMYYYRGYGNKLFKAPFQNDDQFAQQAIFITLYHWGFHAWGCYILVALLLGFVSFRWDMPMTLRVAFFPLLGDVVFGFFGDCIDFLSMACTTFGVCTSLGMGVDIILAGLRRLDCRQGALCASNVPANACSAAEVEAVADDENYRLKEWKWMIIFIITGTATLSVVTGLRRGLKTFSQITFTLGNLLLFSLVYLDNTWFLLNSYVQSMGHYLQYITVVGFETDAWQQLSLEFKATSNLWDQAGFTKDADGNSVWRNKLYETVTKATGQEMADPVEYYGSHNSAWIDWWTVFYWGWWISWAPFVGMFVATISRGRTIRQVVLGAFAAPIIYSFFFLVVLGSLGIKMQRTVELGLGVGPDPVTGLVDCAAMGYEGGVPTSDAAINLANAGYFALSCRAHADRLWDVLSPYGPGMYMFLGVIAIIGTVLYFVTSSDSGSFVDDVLSANGLQEGPHLQRVYWAVTEGAAAFALTSICGENALKALRSVSIVAGLPLTFAICYFCAALHRACKYDQGEEDIIKSTRFITGLFDIFEGFEPNMPVLPNGVQLPNVADRAGSLIASIVAPFFTINSMTVKLWGTVKGAVITATIAVLFVCWIGCMLGEIDAVNASYVGWVCYTGMITLITIVRLKAREAYNVYGFWAEDFFASLTMYPFVCSQLQLQAERVDPVVDISADPNAHLYASEPVQPNFKVADPQNVVYTPGPMMMQGMNPAMMPGLTMAGPPPMQGFPMQMGGMGGMGGPMPMQPMGGMPFNGFA